MTRTGRFVIVSGLPGSGRAHWSILRSVQSGGGLGRHHDGVRMLYMVIESFRGGDPVPVYRRFRDRGRLMPDGIEYRGSWVTEDLRRCFQIMECEDRRLLDEWMANWSDITHFDVIPVVTSSEAAAAVAPRL